MNQFRLVLTLVFVQHLKVVHLQSSSTTLSTEREIFINNFIDFQDLWTSEDFTDNQSTIPNNPGNLRDVWYISSVVENDPIKIFKVSFNITQQACDTTELRIKIKYFSSNAAVTLYPVLSNQDEYFNLEVSNPEAWNITDEIDIDISDGKVEISGVVLPKGFFIFDEIKIIVNANYEDGCNPATTEIYTTITTEETTVYESVETEMISGSTAELTTFETTTVLIETTALFTETEMTTEQAITENTEPPDFESSSTTNEEFTSESTTTISESTTESAITSTIEESSSPTESTTENSMTSIRTLPEFSTDSTSNPTTEESSSSESTTENSATESVFTSPTSEKVTSEYTSTPTSGLSSIFSTKESVSTISTIVPIFSSTSESSNPDNDGLSTEDILLFIVLPSVVVLGIISVGFSVAYLSPWCKSSIGNKGISITVSNNGHGLGQVTPGPNQSHVSLNLQPSSEYEIPRPRFRHQ